jgi:hypothetical protein
MKMSQIAGIQVDVPYNTRSAVLLEPKGREVIKERFNIFVLLFRAPH